MKYILTCSYDDFIEQLNLFTDKCKKIIESPESSNDLKSFHNELNDNIKKLLVDSIKPNADSFIEVFENSSYSFYESIIYGKSDHDWIERINRTNSKIIHLKEIVSLVDSFQNINDASEIKSLTDKQDFVLKKLLSLFNDKFYSIEQIFKVNMISFRDKETDEIADDLKRRGYVHKKVDWSGDDVKLTVKGASFIERKLKSKISKKSKEKTSTINLDEKLDAIIIRLKELGYGQEIIFNEIEELRDYQTTLSKKSWTQLLKGKLVDLGVDEVINKETALMIYEFLTNDKLKLM